MAESENTEKPYSEPPPSYEEVMSGNQQRRHDPDLPAIHTAAPPSPSAPPIIRHHSQPHHISQELQPFHPIPQPQPHLYSTPLHHACPPGAEPILNLNEILIYPGTGWSMPFTYKIKDSNKVHILSSNWISDGGCCDACAVSSSRFTLYPLDTRLFIATADFVNEDCWSPNKKHMEVIGSPDIPFGTVRINTASSCHIENQSGDLLFSITRKHSWLQYHPFEVFLPSGTKVGHINRCRGHKNKLTVPREMPVQHKILLIFFTLRVQFKEDVERRNPS